MLFRSLPILGVLLAAILLLSGSPTHGATTAVSRYVSAESGTDIGGCTSSFSPCATITYATGSGRRRRYDQTRMWGVCGEHHG